MKLKPIITSLLEQDFYKFTMGQWIFHNFNKTYTHWGFKCRTKDVRFTPEMITEIKEQIEHYCSLRFTEEELAYLNSIEYLHEDYVEYLEDWHPRMKEIQIGTDSPCGLTVEIFGRENRVSYYETPIMAIICEVYYRLGGKYDELFEEYKKQVADIIDGFNTGRYHLKCWSDFGFRRRLSGEGQDYFMAEITKAKVSGFIGTSNVYLAMKYGVKAIGSVAHQATQLMQGDPKRNPAYANKWFLDSWYKEYGQLPGIALTDCIGTDIFLKDFTRTYSMVFGGVRHDSADPYAWGEKLIKHYQKYNIDPKSKTLLFSDSLTFVKATELEDYFSSKAGTAYGLGGACCSPHGNELNIVIKIIDVDGNPVAKLSDIPITPENPGKSMCRDPKFIWWLQDLIKWRLDNDK